ncbi:hypothetical protein BGZ80_002433 [Entomortierella chlamydospora]|uniref:Vacuolar import and degradation protein n=1 Tax=Entomortierella chlamydospora TaxID=101097 RepID=A0A9P6T5J6_9FUNG|nr:hypothetical protein BGZ80_002433 [Entomortierella chlamydospora]
MSLRPRPDSDNVGNGAVLPITLTNRRQQSHTLHQQPQLSQQRLHSIIHSTAQDTSDADASSDFSSLSEVDLHRDVHSEDFSDYETPFGGRWDLTAHWHLGDYSEGVEGDADDDDDEERDNDTDLSEGPRLGRTINLDLGRVREILGSSPSSTPIIIPSLSTMTTGTATTAAAAAEGREFSLILPLRSVDPDLHSSASEEFEVSHTQGRQPTVATASPERTVRFSRDPQRIHTPIIPSEMSLRTNHLNSMLSEHHALEGYDVHPDMYHADMDDSQGDGGTRRESQSSTNSVNGNSTRDQSASGSSTGDIGNRLNRTALGSIGTGRGEHLTLSVVYDIDAFLRLDSTRASSSTSSPSSVMASDQSNLRAGSQRIHTLQHPPSPSLGREERRYQFRNAIAIASRQNLSSTSRSYISPYWSAHSRYQQHPFSPSPLSSLSPSPVSSASSSRITSPAPESSSLSSNKPSDADDVYGSNLDMNQQQGQNPENEKGDPTLRNEPHSDRDGASKGILSPLATSADSSRFRRVISSNISSLPSFASSVFMPKIQGSGCYGYGGGDGTFSTLGRPLKPNHPRRQCCFLQPGQKFSGTQNLKAHLGSLSGLRSRQREEWRVKVTISAVDYDAGAVYGLMEAIGVPNSSSNVVTFWEGEIIDFENHTFWTKKWTAKAETDVEHWRRMEAFQGIDKKYIVKGAKTGKFRGHIDQKYIFMRWKEKHFVNTTEHSSGLTIAGFYYVSLRRSDGYVEGYYHDQESTPFQHLTLNPVFDAGGFSSSIFQIA